MINKDVKSLKMLLSLWLQSIDWYTDDEVQSKCVLEVENLLKLIIKETKENEEL